jgi:hypothetical protein
MGILEYNLRPLPTEWGTSSPGRHRNNKKYFLRANEQVTLNGEGYWNGTYFDVDSWYKSNGEIILLQGSKKEINFGDYDRNTFDFEGIEWDTDKNKPVNLDTKYNDAYFLGRTFYEYPIIMWLFFFLSLGYLYTSAQGYYQDINHSQGYWILTAPILLLIFCIYKGGVADALARDAMQTIFKAHLTQEGYFLPIDHIEYDSENMVGYTWAYFLKVIYYPLWYAYIAFFAYLIPSFVRGLHYLSLSHPTDDHLVRDDTGLPPDIDEKGITLEHLQEMRDIDPAWIARNKAKKAQANARKVESWESLLKTIREYKKNRHRQSDDKPEDS